VAVWAATRGDGLDILSSAVNVGVMTAFILLHASVIGYFLVKKLGTGPGNWFLHGAVPAVGAAFLVVVLASATPVALTAGLIWFVLGLAVAAIMFRRRKGVESGA
jgi:hypothetical protein